MNNIKIIFQIFATWNYIITEYLETEINLNFTQRFIWYLTVKTIFLDYKNQPVNATEVNNRRLVLITIRNTLCGNSVEFLDASSRYTLGLKD
jgi:hypothetical protein